MKHVVQYGIFAAYHLAVETSFLADEGASLPELPMPAPSIVVPEKSSSIERSISTVPGFTVPANEISPGLQSSPEHRRSHSVPISDLTSSIGIGSVVKMEKSLLPSLANGDSLQSTEPTSSLTNSTASLSTVPSSGKVISDSFHTEVLSNHKGKNETASKEALAKDTSAANNGQAAKNNHHCVNVFEPLDTLDQGIVVNNSQDNSGFVIANRTGDLEVSSTQQDSNNYLEEPKLLKEEFPPSPSDHQSILVSLSSRCVWKGTVCERSHLFRIKYYGSFDKPLGRFLRDHLFDQVS